jgi:hypothetical protein
MENKNKYTASVTRHNVTMEDINSFINENIVKFIFLGKEYSDLSSDKTINEIHKLKSKYRGNTYIRIPLNVIKKEDDKYVRGIEIGDSEDKADGFVVLSKHDLIDLSDDMKRANKEERIEYGKKICEEKIETLNNILKNNVLQLIVKDGNNDVVANRYINGGDFQTINNNVQKVIEEINKEKTEII